MSLTLLLLPFATLVEGDEVSAKLARQIPRLIGAEIERATAAHGVRAKYLSSRGSTPQGTPGLVASTSMTSGGELLNFGELYGADIVVTGQLGLRERDMQLEVQVFQTAKKAAGFAKRFETFPSYVFDALEESKLRITQLLGLILTDDERIVLFQRATESWQAFLFYVLAEDERYGLSIGILPKDVLAPLALYREALLVDPAFEKATAGLQHYLLLLVEGDLISSIQLRGVLDECAIYLSDEVREALLEII